MLKLYDVKDVSFVSLADKTGTFLGYDFVLVSEDRSECTSILDPEQSYPYTEKMESKGEVTAIGTNHFFSAESLAHGMSSVTSKQIEDFVARNETTSYERFYFPNSKLNRGVAKKYGTYWAKQG